MKEIKKGNLKILYNETMWSPEKSRKKTIQCKVVSVGCAICLFVLFAIIFFILAMTNVNEIVGVIISIFAAFVLFAAIVGSISLSIGKIYGKYIKLYELLDYLYECNNIETGLFNKKFFMRITDKCSTSMVSMGFFKNRLSDSIIVKNNFPEDYNGCIETILDLTKFPESTISINSVE